MANVEIRSTLLEANMKHWQLADLLGISEFTLCRRLRKELSKEEKAKIIKLIKGKGQNGID